MSNRGKKRPPKRVNRRWIADDYDDVVALLFYADTDKKDGK